MRDTRKLERIRSVAPGASVVDPERRDWIEQARSALGGAGAEVLFDNIGSSLGESAIELVADDGHFSAHSTPSGAFANIDAEQAHRREVTIIGIETAQPDPDALGLATDLALAGAAANEFVPVIGQTFPLDRAADAHTAIEARTVFGKTPADHVSASMSAESRGGRCTAGQVFGA